MDEKPLKPTEQQGLTIQRVDLPELSETFANWIKSVVFDGQTLRINCGVTDMNNRSRPRRRTDIPHVGWR